MKKNHEIVIGHNVRHWTTFELVDASPSEIEVLASGGVDADQLARQLFEAGRLRELYTDTDDDPPMFDDSDTEVVDFAEQQED